MDKEKFQLLWKRKRKTGKALGNGYGKVDFHHYKSILGFSTVFLTGKIRVFNRF